MHKTRRGAGGGCFIKDFAAFRGLYAHLVPEDVRGRRMLEALEQKNIELLVSTGKDPALLEGVYGPSPLAAPAVRSYFFLPPMRAVDNVLIAAGCTVIALGIVSVAILLADAILK